MSLKVDTHASIVWFSTLPMLYNLSNSNLQESLQTILQNLKKTEDIDSVETKIKKTYLSQLNINLKLLQVECLVGLAQENAQHLDEALAICQNLNSAMIKSFGNGQVAMIEIFIKPILLYTNLCQMLGQIGEAQQNFMTLSQLIHELYGEESDLEV